MGPYLQSALESGRGACPRPSQFAPHSPVTMTVPRLFIVALSSLMGLWVFGSFAGVMFGLDNAGFWTTSLMWSLLVSALVMPVLVVLHHATVRAERRSTQIHGRRTATPPRLQPSFVRDEEREGAIKFGPATAPPPEDDAA